MTDYAPQLPYGSVSFLCTGTKFDGGNYKAWNQSLHAHQRRADLDVTLIDRRDGTAGRYTGEMQTTYPGNYGRDDGRYVPALYAAFTVVPKPTHIVKIKSIA